MRLLLKGLLERDSVVRRLEDEVLRCTKESERALDEERNARVAAEDRVGVLEARKAELKQRVVELEEQVEKQAAQSRCAPFPIARRDSITMHTSNM